MTFISKILNRISKKKLPVKNVGESSSISAESNFVFPERISIGKYVHIEAGCYFNGRGGLTIQDHCIFGPEVAIMTSMHRHREASMLPYDEVELLRTVLIERFVWVGMRAMILPGVTLREGTIVGAGAVVTKSFPAGAIIAGNPAVQIGTRDMDEFVRLVAEGKFYLKLKSDLQLNKIEIYQ